MLAIGKMEDYQDGVQREKHIINLSLIDSLWGSGKQLTLKSYIHRNTNIRALKYSRIMRYKQKSNQTNTKEKKTTQAC